MDLEGESKLGAFIVGTFCRGCDLPLPINDIGLCEGCYAKLERDLIRMRDWEYSAEALSVPSTQLEALRELIIHDYGAACELLEQPHLYKPKNKRSPSRTTQRKREIAAQAARNYTTEDVLQATQNFIRAQAEEWVNFSRVAQHLYERFYNLKPKRLGQPGKKYKSLLKFLADYPSDLELRQDNENNGIFWIRLR